LAADRRVFLRLAARLLFCLKLREGKDLRYALCISPADEFSIVPEDGEDFNRLSFCALLKYLIFPIFNIDD